MNVRDNWHVDAPWAQLVCSTEMPDDVTEKILELSDNILKENQHDPKDESIPNLGVIQINDSETGEFKWINTQSSSVRKAYSDYYYKNVSFFESIFKKNGAGILTCRVDESYVRKLLNFFNLRG